MKAKHRSYHSSLGKLGQKAAIADINVTPFVDVCLVLLIIFMVVTPLLSEGVSVNLPVTLNPEPVEEPEGQLKIAVRSDGSVYVGDTVVRQDQIKSEMQKVYDDDPGRSIAVKGDREVSYGAVLEVLKASRDAGFQNLGLVSQPAKSPSTGTVELTEE